MNVNEFILEDSIWSYSRINAFELCPYQYYLQYIKGIRSGDNAFGEYGTFMHSIFEKYFKGELNIFELEDYFIKNYYENVKLDFPPSRVDLKASYFEKGREYFENFSGFEGECKGVEQKYFFKVGNYDFTGIIDYEGIVNGEVEIIDHKSKTNKDSSGRLACKTRLTQKDLVFDYIELVDGRFLHREFIRQLYLYCIPLYEKYKKYPAYLNLNMCKENDWYRWEFNKSDFEETKQWAIDIINRIYKTEKFLKGDMTKDNYFCDWICGVSGFCKNSSKFLGVEI